MINQFQLLNRGVAKLKERICAGKKDQGIVFVVNTTFSLS